MEKERLIKVLSIATLLISIVSLTIPFAAMSKTLTINGTAKMDTAVWDIHFDSAIVKSKKGDAKEVQSPQITNGGIDLVLKVSLRKPKDDITVKIVIRYKNITDESLLATTAYDIPLTFKINYAQKDVGNNIPSTPEGDDSSKAVLFHNISLIDSSEPFFNSPIKRYIVEILTFSKGITKRNNNTWDASAAGDGSIIGYYEDSNNNGYYEVYIESENDIYAPADSSYLFSEMTSLKEINFNNFKTSDVKNISGMFNYCSSLTNLDLSSFNIPKLKSISSMFSGCSALRILRLNSADFSDMIYYDNSYFDAFTSCSNITVYVKDETAAEYINIAFKSNGATGTTVIEPLES